MRYLEDIAVGDTFNTDILGVTEQDIRNFAEQFDPQPFHLDPGRAEASVFRGLVASGWHTAALTMRLIAGGGMQLAEGVIGLGVEALQWPQPVRPGDRLQVVSEVLEVRPSRSRPTSGIVRVRNTTLNQAGEVVQVMIANLLVPRRSPPACEA